LVSRTASPGCGAQAKAAEVHIACDGAPFEIEPEQVMLAWKFHFILSTTNGHIWSPLCALSKATRAAFRSHNEQQQNSWTGDRKMYFVIPLRERPATAQGKSGRDDATRTMPSIDWTLMQQTARLAEESIHFSPASFLQRCSSSSSSSSSAIIKAEAEDEPKAMLHLDRPIFPSQEDEKNNNPATSFCLTTKDKRELIMEEPLALYTTYAPERFYLFLRSRPDLTPASPFSGIRIRAIEHAENVNVRFGSFSSSFIASHDPFINDGLQDAPPSSSLAGGKDDDRMVNTFASHYRNRYGVEVREDQILLEASFLSHPKNLLRPPSVASGSSDEGEGADDESENRNKRTLRRATLYLLPELCCVHPISGKLLREAFLLPYVLWKAEFFFLVDEFIENVGWSPRTSQTACTSRPTHTNAFPLSHSSSLCSLVCLIPLVGLHSS